MNGRIYDPVLGRFLSADPTVDDAGDSQAFNRYSYVSNNPLGATDPTGFFKFGDALKIVAIVAVGIVTAGAAIAAIVGWSAVGGLSGGLALIAGTSSLGTLTTLGYAIAGAAGGFASGFAGSVLNGGSVGDAFRAGAIGALTGAVTGACANMIGNAFGHGIGTFENEFERALAHGAVGGAVEEATGGQFRHGFYGSFAGSAAGSLAPSLHLPGYQNRTTLAIAERTTFAAAVGGTASALGGGKFANGAVTSAFQHLFNAEAAEATRQRIYHTDKITALSDWYVKEGERLKIAELPNEIKDSALNLLEEWAKHRELNSLARVAGLFGRFAEGASYITIVRDAMVRYDQPTYVERTYFLELTYNDGLFSSHTETFIVGMEAFYARNSTYVLKQPYAMPLYIKPISGGYLAIDAHSPSL